MKRTLHKITAFLLCAVLLFGTAYAAVAAVAMPEGVSESRVLNAIPKTDTLTAAAVKLSGTDLSTLAYKALFSDDTLNKLFTSVYGALSEQSSTFSTLGVDISVSAVSAALRDFPDVQAALNGKSTWDAVLNEPFTPAWRVSNKEWFSHAMACMLAPLNELLYTLLCGGTYRPNVLISVQGANGYENAVVPLLQAVGTPGILSQADFTAHASQSRYSMVKDLCSMIYGALDQILASPVRSLCKYLPSVADYLINDGLTTSVNTLVEPLKVRVGLISLSGVDKMLENLDVLSSSAQLTEKLESLDTTALFGSDVDLTLPKVDLEALASCGSRQNGVYTANQAQSFVLIFRWAVEAIKLNSAKLPAMLGMDLTSAQGFLDKLLAKDADSILKMVLELLEVQPASAVLDYEWQYPAYTPGTVQYTPNLTRADYERVLAGIDDTLNAFLNEFTENGTLSGILADRLYSGALLGQLVKGVYGALYTPETAGALRLLGLDASPAGLARSISSSCPSAARTLQNYSTWENVNPERISWGFKNGDRDAFLHALTAVLVPFRPFLTMLLAEGQLNVLNAIPVSGSNGYNTAVIPLLEALGCDPNTIKTYDEYKQTANTNAAVTDIITPIAALLDNIVAAPVATMCRVLPNLVYFVNAGGLGKCVENLLYPVRTLLRTIEAEDLLSEELGALSDVDLNKTVGQLIDGAGLEIKLREPDLNALASLGTAEYRQSRRTYRGVPAQYVYINADSPAVLLTVLRYAVGSLGSEENAAAFTGLLQQDQTEEGDLMAMYTGKVAEQLKTMSTDETIEWLYDLLFKETPKNEHLNEENETMPTIVYQPREKHTARNVTVIVVICVLLAVVVGVVLSRTDLTALRERKEREKKQRKEEKERIARLNAAQKAAKTAPQPVQQKTVQQKPVQQQPVQQQVQRQAQPAQPPVPQQPVRQQVQQPVQRQAQAPQQGGVPMHHNNVYTSPAQGASRQYADRTAAAADSGMNEKELQRHQRELAKMDVREEKARMQATRANKKHDKYYQKALKEQQKKG